MLQNLPSQVLQSSMSRRSAEIEMDTIQHVALSGDQQPGVRCWPCAAVAEWVSFATIRYAFEIRRLDVAISLSQNRNTRRYSLEIVLGTGLTMPGGRTECYCARRCLATRRSISGRVI